MGAAKNRHQSEASPSSRVTYNMASARNLNKTQLGGVIFGCSTSTMNECLTNQLFGLPAPHFLYVKNIAPGLPLFLFNYTVRELHGIFEAASAGKMNIDSYAWTAGGSDRTKYPAQVQVRLRLKCQALSEHKFKPIIVDNYYSENHFWFELDHAQASKLISMLSSLAVAPRPFVPQNLPQWTPIAQRFPSSNKREESGVSEPPSSTDDFVKSYDSIEASATSNNSLCLGENNQWMEASTSNSMVQCDEKDLIYMKLKELALSSEFTDSNMIGRGLGAASKSVTDLEHETHDDDDLVTLGKRNGGSSLELLDYPVIIAQLCREMEELKIFKQEIKTFKQEQNQKMASLEKKLAEAEQEIHRLENRSMILESTSNSSTRLSRNQTLIKSTDELHQNLNESILIVGGYVGVSLSSALDSFLPSDDVLRSLKSMSYARSYASVARLNEELYVFGGGSGSMWYDTVESYNAVKDEWTLRPSLNKGKGSLAGAALNGKIFALGGGNGAECFSDVEMFDPYVGRWISARSMLQKRFALAAVELNGALYAVGGYDGKDYLMSAERFDPREHSWTRIGSMNASRGCHSLVAMNEKLYAVGGFDGITMVPSVEIYDPRLGTWMSGEPMNHGRGYSAAAVLGESIYVIGGIKTDEAWDSIDVIECYKEGRQGWEATNLRAVGKRSSASAIVLGGD